MKKRNQKRIVTPTKQFTVMVCPDLLLLANLHRSRTWRAEVEDMFRRLIDGKKRQAP